MRKLPFRPDNEISQTFTSGVCTVFTQKDMARAGYRPRPELKRKAFLRYEEQRLGLSRFNEFMQRDIEVERVIRVPKPPNEQIPTPQDVVRTENGLYYQVELVQSVPGIYPGSLDLTLSKFVQNAAPEPPGGEAP